MGAAGNTERVRSWSGNIQVEPKSVLAIHAGLFAMSIVEVAILLLTLICFLEFAVGLYKTWSE